MKFEQYKFVREYALSACEAEGVKLPETRQLHPILLAYIGDVVFSLYVRMRFLPAASHVRVIHDLGSKAVSAVYQAKALEALMPELTEEEIAVVKRGRNTKSTVPKSASVYEYRMSTAFEALIGWLFLREENDRMEEILNKSFAVIAESLRNK